MSKEADLWLSERVTPHLLQQMRVAAVLYRGHSPYQAIEVLELVEFGRSLVLDGKTQSTEGDEFIYHEALVHPTLLAHPQPQVVMIAGGGEGATLREVLRHHSVRRAVMVDIDEQVVEICRRFLPRHHQGSFADPRTQLVFADAQEFLAHSPEGFDVIILDLTDPTEAGHSYSLFTEGFFRLVRERLNPAGVMVVQAGACGVNNYLSFTAIHHTVSSVFPGAWPYCTTIPSFGGQWGFSLGGLALPPPPTSKVVDRLLQERVVGESRFYDGSSHIGMFSMPKYLRQALAGESRLITQESPLFVP